LTPEAEAIDTRRVVHALFAVLLALNKLQRHVSMSIDVSLADHLILLFAIVRQI